MTYARRKDDNHALIKKAFEQMGCSVQDQARLGEDYPDLLIGVAGVDQLVEVKSAKGALTEGQFKFQNEWRGSRPRVIRTIKEAALLVCEMGERARGKRA